jgi:hypothetical protein
MAVQLIKDDEGKTQYVVIPYDEYFRMCLQMAEIDDETDDDLEDIEVEHDSLDDVELPGEVCSIMTWQDVSLQAAWRILRGLSQQEVADKLGISQSAVSQLEALDSPTKAHPRKAGGNLRL